MMRDKDILQRRKNLVSILVSILCLSKTRRVMEPPRTTTGQRLRLIEEMSKAGVKMECDARPNDTRMNDHEMHNIIKASEAGATFSTYTFV